MFFQHTLKPTELLKVIHHVEECFFTISANLTNRFYQVAVYKYNNDYFLLRDERLFEQVKLLDDIQGDENQLLPFIEATMEDNLYLKTEEAYICLDLNVLAKMAKKCSTEICYYEFIEL